MEGNDVIRKMIGLFAFVATCYLFLLTNIVRHENVTGIIISIIIFAVSAVGFKGHYNELKG